MILLATQTNTNFLIREIIREQFPSDGVFCVFVVFRIVLLEGKGENNRSKK